MYRRRDFAGSCYLPNPDPPGVRRRRRARAQPTTNPAASFSPSSGTAADTYTLSASGFRPNVTLSVRLTRPDGASESYSIRTNGSGSGSYTFPRVADAITGTYTAVVSDPGSGDRATASATVAAAQQAEPDQGGLQCDPPRSQLEFEQCAERNSPQNPDPNYDCPDQPPALARRGLPAQLPGEPLDAEGRLGVPRVEPRLPARHLAVAEAPHRSLILLELDGAGAGDPGCVNEDQNAALDRECPTCLDAVAGERLEPVAPTPRSRPRRRGGARSPRWRSLFPGRADELELGIGVEQLGQQRSRPGLIGEEGDQVALLAERAPDQVRLLGSRLRP